MKNIIKIFISLAILFSHGSIVQAKEFFSHDDVVFTNYNNTRSILKLDAVYQVDIPAGKGFILEYDIVFSGYYTAETFTYGNSTVDTYITVMGPLFEVSDDDSGNGLNAAAGFYAPSNTKIQVFLSGATSTASGKTLIQLRRQRANLYTFDYGNGDINTTQDATIPRNKLNSYYATSSNINKLTSHPFESDSTQLPRMMSEIFFTSGHGPVWVDEAGNIVGYGGAAKFMDDNIRISDIPLGIMQNTKLAVWSNCYSANSNNHWGKSLVKHAVDSGAASAIGFVDTVLVTSATQFTDIFFTDLANGSTINQAAQAASNSFTWGWDKAKDYKVEGNGNYVIFNYKVKPKQASTIDVKLLNDFMQNQRKYKYETIDLEGNAKRFYKIIGDVITNDFYDVFYNESGEIISIYKSKNEINQDSVDLNYLNRKPKIGIEIPSIIHVNGLNYFENSIDKHNVLINHKNRTKLVEISYVDYLSESIDDNIANIISKVYCFDLSTGEEIEYSEISLVEYKN